MDPVSDPLVVIDARSALIDAIEADSAAIIVEIRQGLRERFSSYESVPTETIDRHIAISLGHALSLMRSGTGRSGDASDSAGVEAMAQVGADEAELGIPVDDLLGVWRIGLQVVVRRGRRVAGQLGLGDHVALDFAEAVLSWSDVAMGASARAHREAEMEIFRRDQRRRTAFVVGVLTGTLGPSEIRRQASAHGIELHREYVAVRAQPAPGVAPWELERELGFHATAAHRHGLDALLDGAIVGFLAEVPADVSKGVVGAGPPRTAERLADSYRLATRALTTAEGFDLSGVHTLESLGIRPAIVADRDVAEALYARYLAPVLDTGSGAELLGSVLVWFEQGMHVERAAELLHVHPNTLRYRMSRFEELTDASLRDMTTALEVWWALQARTALSHLAAE